MAVSWAEQVVRMVCARAAAEAVNHRPCQWLLVIKPTDDGSGINIDVFNANERVMVTNRGQIVGNSVTGDGDGVDVDGLVNLHNFGTIVSRAALNDTSEGVTVGGGTIVNSGRIEGRNTNGGASRGVTLAGLD